MAKTELLPGTLDLLILKTLSRRPMHGYAISKHVRQISEDALQVEEGSLYPALQRLHLQGFIRAEWKQTPTNRRARYYRLTAAGKKQLGIEETKFQQFITAMARVMGAA